MLEAPLSKRKIYGRALLNLVSRAKDANCIAETFEDEEIADLFDDVEPPSLEEFEELFEEAKKENRLDFVNYSQSFSTLKKLCDLTDSFQSPKTYSLLRKFLAELPQFATQLDAQGIANILHTLASLSYNEERASLQILLDLIPPRIEQFNLQNIANSLWAVAVLDYTEYSTVEFLVKSAKSELKNGHRIDDRSIDQLHEFHIITNRLPEIGLFFESEKTYMARDSTVSRMQKRIAQIIKNLLGDTYVVQTGIVDINAGIELDITITSPADPHVRINFEVDSYYHCLTGLQDAMKDRIRAALGWQVFRKTYPKKITDSELTESIRGILETVKLLIPEQQL